jgi:outer membrane protein
MNRIFLCLLGMVFLLLQLLPAAAQEAQKANPLTLQEILDIALKNQVDIKVAENNTTAAKARETRAKSQYLPQVSVRNNTFTVGSNGVLTERNNGTALGATMNIYDGGVREADVAGARYGLTATQAGAKRTTQSVIFDATRAYYEVLRAKHLAEVASASVKYNEALKEVVQSRVAVGDAAAVDVLPVESQLANARVNLIAAENAVRVANVQLQNAIGLSPKSDFDVQDITTPPTVEQSTLETYLAEASSNRPDILQSKAEVGAAKASVKSSKIALYPIPTVTADYETGLSRVSGTSMQVFGGITFDLFNGGKNRAAYNEARANQSSAEQLSEQLVKDIQSQVQQAYFSLNDAKERLSASQVGFDAAQKNYDVQQEKYKQGLAITLDLLNAEVQVVTAQTNLVQARYDLYSAIAQMEFVVGKNGGVDGNQK